MKRVSDSNIQRMVCIKKMNIVDPINNSHCNLTLGKQYDIVTLSSLNESDEMKEPSNNVIVLSDDLKHLNIYPLEAFVSLKEWREIQIKKLL